MRIGRDKTSTAGHIKRNTQGTSNEISFSVLDSMKGQDEEDDGDSPLGRISLFTLGPDHTSSSKGGSGRGGRSSRPSRASHHGPSAAPGAPRPRWESSDSEVKARRASRKRSRRAIVGVISVLCIIALAFAGILGYGRYQTMQARAQDLDAQIEDVREQYGVAEPLLQLTESTLNTPLSDIDAAALNQQLADWETRQQFVVTQMRVTKTALDQLQDQLGGRDLDRANSAIAAMNATINAMNAALTVLEEISQAAQVYQQAAGFMTHAMAGDAAAREAVDGELTDNAAAEAAIQRSNDAIAEFAAARDAVDAVISQGSWIIDQSGAFDQKASDLLKPFVDYANLRIEAQEYAIDADEGYLNLASQQMRDANASYNATEEQAAELIAQHRGSYPTDIVQQAYDATIAVDDQVSSWQTEWTRAQQELEKA